MILDKIVAHKLKQIEREKRMVTIDELKEKLKNSNIPDTKDFYKALNKPDGISMIAEVKKASPSKGIICHDFEPVKIAHTYFQNNVEAISVLTESEFFMGSDEYLARIRQNVPIPLLRKDFIIDCWQVYQSRMLGADAILLIVSILDDEKLKKFQIIANILGMQCLVEVHDEREVERALQCGAKIIGINNRNLKTFETSLSTTERLIKLIPKDILVVSESGIKDYNDMNTLRQLGVSAVLIGETLVKSACIQEKIAELRYGIGA
ncbi:MAG: indole-3-glycerol phosphate synthase [Petroclostridium sp.]|jgi:indole-3-glycerol phosphate synthase|uniref:indole-3-glycerol phosphate synthase TrpC n=1 Tax=Petroclostridium xylanilyticum TaxID=1792311 RepID=UPI000B98611B|nr:indole-3-glycerol phosphate synthase TrpC [Petroclostridium xylanilyticum]MBZ4644791.1 trpC [Clostridia bacterium]MDK2810887.1 indole-3-glycerol phosphate synthase [Petroclostridium sp.]